MTLAEYIAAEGLERREVCEALAISRQTLHYWMQRPPGAIPQRAAMRRIHEWSGGKVDANAFYGLKAPPEIVRTEIEGPDY